MIRALYTAASGMSAQQLNLDTIANNLANSSTTGFRQLRLQFQDMIYQNLITPGAAQSQSTVSAGLQIGLGTRSVATEVIMTQGELNQTNNPLDMAIEGSGFFQVQRPDGTIDGDSVRRRQRHSPRADQSGPARPDSVGDFRQPRGVGKPGQ
jgi:flagellar basal-body rod protein FlgG